MAMSVAGTKENFSLFEMFGPLTICIESVFR